MTLDGKIATVSGESKWITGEVARRHVHELRSGVDAIMVGIGTVIKDNPELSVRQNLSRRRTSKVRQPVRVVLDSRLRISPKARVLRWPVEQSTMVCTTSKASKTKMQQLEKSHVTVLQLPQKKGKVSLITCFRTLGQMGITSVVVEGGSELNAAVLQAGLVNQVQLYVAPRLLGGQNAISVIGGPSPNRLKHAVAVDDLRIQKMGEDFICIGKCSPKSHR